MIQKFFITTIALLFISLGISAQKIDSKKYINRVHKEYVEKLQLNQDQNKKLKDILKEYNPKIQQLIKKKRSNTEINRMIKLSIGEIYGILKPEQVKKFNQIRKDVEPLKKYRFDS